MNYKKQAHLSSKQKMTIVKEILINTVDVAKDVHQIFTRPSSMMRDYPVFPKKSKKTIYDTICRLENEGYLKKVEINGEKKYLTTLKGKAKILRFLKIDKKWDKKWRIVIFDIPEKKRRMRNDFRNRLREIGFRKLQESVWICPYNVSDIIEELINLYNAEQYVHYLLVEELDNRDVLMELFKLKEK